MKKHRQKLLLLLALALLVGSAAASAANYTAGRGAMPTFEGASDAFDVASSSVVDTTTWLISRARSVASSAFSYGPPNNSRPAEVPTPSKSLPMYGRGLPEPIDVNPYWEPITGQLATPPLPIDPTQAILPQFSPVSSINLPNPLASPSIPNGGGNTISRTIVDIPPVPEPSTYIMMIAGILLMGVVIYHRRSAFHSNSNQVD